MKINLTNDAKVESKLGAVNGRAREHCYLRASDLHTVARRAEKKLAGLGIPVATRQGAALSAVSGERVARGYRGWRVATEVTLVRGSREWFVTKVSRGRVGNAGGCETLILTKLQDQRAVISTRSNYVY